MPRTERALSGVATLLTRCSAVAAAATLLAGFAAAPATAGPDTRETLTVQSTGAISDEIELVASGCPPDTGGYDPMQDYVDTLIWLYYHPDWRIN